MTRETDLQFEFIKKQLSDLKVVILYNHEDVKKTAKENRNWVDKNFVTKVEFAPVKDNFVSKDSFDPIRRTVFGVIGVSGTLFLTYAIMSAAKYLRII